jgi:uncharacterized protein
LLGIGGGSVMVPILTLTFVARGYSPDHVIHMALATSMATIIPGAFASARTHHKLGAVNWTLVKQMTPGILVGTLLGTLIAFLANTAFLKSFFVAFICFLAFQMVLGVRIAARYTRTQGLPGIVGVTLFGMAMGVVSALAGIGGAVLSILFLTWANVRMHEAIGTAAAIGLPLAIVGTIGFIATGLADSNLPPWSVGYVYVPAFLGIAATSFFIAPYGARLAHRLPVDTLKKVFMVFLVALAIKMAVSV